MDVSTFRGASGEVVRGFVHPRTFLTLFPAAIALAISGLPIMAVGVGMGVPDVLIVPLALLAVGPLVGRFALAARHGELTAGFAAARPERATLVGFVARYAALTTLWTALALAGARALPPTPWAETLTTATRMALLGCAATVATLLAIALAARAESIGEALGLRSWRWLVRERGSDVVVLIATFVGAGTTFMLMGWPVGLALEPVVETLIHDLGFEPPHGLRWSVPLLGLLVLAGRLGGAFAAEDEGLQGREDALRDRMLASGALPANALTALTGGAAAAPAGPAAPASTAPRSAADRLGSVADDDLGQAVLEAEQLMQMEPHKPNVAAELARLYQRAGCDEESQRVAGLAIERALAASMPSVAALVFHRFEPGERDGFALGAPVLEQLAWLLLRRKEIEGALWCFDAFGRAGGASAHLEKGLVAVADAVALGGDQPRAVTLYRSFLERFPRSSAADYVRSVLLRFDAGTRREHDATPAA